MREFKFNFDDLIGMQEISDRVFCEEGDVDEKRFFRDLHSLCSSCGRLRFKEFFKPSQVYSSGVRKDCNECLDKKRAYMQIVPVKKRDVSYAKEYYENNRDKILQQKREYNERNKKKKRLYDKKRYLENKNKKNA